MTTTVKCFTYTGMISLPVSSFSGAKADNAVWVLRQPYLANETLTASTGSAVSSAAALSTSDHVKLMRVEVQTGKRVHYEITPKNHDARTATADSPTIVGDETLHFGSGWTISLLESS